MLEPQGVCMKYQSQHLNVAMFIGCGYAPSRKHWRCARRTRTYGSVSIRRAYGTGKTATARFVEKVRHEHANSRFKQFDLISGKKRHRTCRWRFDAMDAGFFNSRWMFFLLCVFIRL